MARLVEVFFLNLLKELLSGSKSGYCTIVKTILIFNPGAEGGIQRYSYFQGKALRDLGCEVKVLCDEGHSIREQEGLQVQRVLVPERPRRSSESKLSRILHIAGRIVRNEWRLTRMISKLRPDVVLLSSYNEYLSPIWIWFQLICKKIYGVTYVANLHDPVRDFVVGPGWWHTLSVRMAYWPLFAIYVHQNIPDQAKVPRGLLVREVPHGLFDSEGDSGDSASIRQSEWDVPSEAVVFLAFGFIRDGKNIDLLIRALVESPSAYLVVMGRVQSASSNRPVSYYLELADDLGVSKRVKIFEGFVPDGILGSYLSAADVIAVTYSGSFHSQSGVLNTIANADKPLLASAGESPLKDCILRFDLGVFIPPDNPEKLSEGMARMCQMVERNRQGVSSFSDSPRLRWEDYRRFASWKTNAGIVLDTLKEV